MKWTSVKINQFIVDDLYYELRSLLGAAELNEIFRTIDAGFSVAIAMDAIYLHSRTLLNFFAGTRGNDVSVKVLGCSGVYTSIVFDEWEKPLNRHVMHISAGRLEPSNTTSSGHLNEQAQVFTAEILRLWKQLEEDLVASAFSVGLEDARARAVRDAANDAAWWRKRLDA